MVIGALAALAPSGTAWATAPVARDGLATIEDIGGLNAVAASRVAAARWAATLPAPGRGSAATGVLRAAGGGTLTLVSRSVLTASAADARRLAATLRRRPAKRWARVDAAAARARLALFRGEAGTVFSSGPVVGRVAVAGVRPALARTAARSAATAIATRLRALRAQTVWQQVSSPGGQGNQTTRALQAFAIAFGVRVPGVTVPRGRVGSVGDATATLWTALGRLREMSGPQQAVVRRVAASLGPAATATTGQAARAAKTTPVWTQSPALQAEAQAAGQLLAARLHFNLSLALVVGTTTAKAGPGILAVTQPESVSGPEAGVPVRCFITVYDDGAKTTGVFRTEILTHEMFHCFQAQMAGDLAGMTQRVARGTVWLVEGGADWAACQAVPDPVAEPAFSEWLGTPWVALSKRAYDGVGFFQLLSVNGIDVWPRWPQIMKSANTAAAYTAAVGDQGDTIRDDWAASALQEPARGPGWGPGTPPCLPEPNPPPSHDVFVADGQKLTLKAPAFGARLLRLQADTDLVHVQVPDGKLRISSLSPAADVAGLGDRWFCVDRQSDCRCPHGSTRASDPLPQRVDPGGGTVLALSGVEGGLSGSIEGVTREEYCGVKLGLIVPGRSIGDAYLGQTRRSLLKAISGLGPIESGFSAADANGLLKLGPAVAGKIFLQIHFGLCSSPTIPAGARGACRAQFPQSTPDQVGSIQTFSDAFTTAGGLGPGSEASDVVAAVGAQYCEREPNSNDPQNAAWASCNVPDASGGRTTWGFDTTTDHNTVLAVAVFNPRSFPD